MVATVAALAPEIAPKMAEVPTAVTPRTAAHRADTGLDEIHQPLRHAAAAHQLAGIDEERHGQQRRRVDGGEQVLMHHHQRHIHEEHQRHRDRGQQNQEDRKAEQQKHDRHDREGECHGFACSGAVCPSGAACGVRRAKPTRRQTVTIRISAKPAATAPWGIHIGTPAMSLVRPIRSICRA